MYNLRQLRRKQAVIQLDLEKHKGVEIKQNKQIAN